MRISMLKGNAVLKTVNQTTIFFKSVDASIGYFSSQKVKCIRHSQICYKKMLMIFKLTLNSGIPATALALLR